MSITISGRTFIAGIVAVIVIVPVAIGVWAIITYKPYPFFKPDIEKIRELMHQYVNEERAKFGKAPLDYNYELEAVAETHSLEMAQYGYAGHTNRAGDGPGERLIKAGLKCSNPHVAENIAQIPTRSDVNNDEAIAKSAVRVWMNSTQGHRENLLSSSWKSEGFGVAFNANGDTAYITQNFCD